MASTFLPMLRKVPCIVIEGWIHLASAYGEGSRKEETPKHEN